MGSVNDFVDSYLTTCQKQDIPEVQAVIEILRAEARNVWTSTFQEALVDLEEQLDTVDNVASEAQGDELLLSAVFQTFANLARRATLRSGLQTVSARRLYNLGSRLSGGAEIDFSRPRAAGFLQAANTDLDFWLSRRVHERREDVLDALREYRALPDRRALAEALRAIIGDESGAYALIVVDTWAYRKVNEGAVIAADQEANVSELVAINNPPTGPDKRTTPFCRNIHNTAIRTEVLLAQIAAYYEAVEEEDVEAAKEMWPLLEREEATLLGGVTVEQVINDRGLGVPPYHFFCRTVLQRVRRDGA